MVSFLAAKLACCCTTAHWSALSLARSIDPTVTILCQASYRLKTKHQDPLAQILGAKAIYPDPMESSHAAKLATWCMFAYLNALSVAVSA